jgi:hypothetical protein
MKKHRSMTVENPEENKENQNTNLYQGKGLNVQYVRLGQGKHAKNPSVEKCGESLKIPPKQVSLGMEGNLLAGNKKTKKKPLFGVINEEGQILQETKKISKRGVECKKEGGKNSKILQKQSEECIVSPLINLENNKQENPKIENPLTLLKDFKTCYLQRENTVLINSYGATVYNYIRNLELDSTHGNFLYRHKINPEIRTKMVDWMVEVLSVYKSELDTFFLAVSLMDNYIDKSPSMIHTEDIHLIGITCIFLASKFEDVIPIRMDCIVTKIGHEQFSAQTIKIKERQILAIIEFDNLIRTSIYEFIKTYFFDFKFNNKSNIENFGLEKVVDAFEKVSIYMARLTLHFDGLYHYR